MKVPLSILVFALVTTALASAASAHVVTVTAAIPAATASSNAELEEALVVVLDDAMTHTVAFVPTHVTLEDVQLVGDQIYLILLIVDADGEQLLQQLQRDDRASAPSRDGASEPPAKPTI